MIVLVQGYQTGSQGCRRNPLPAVTNKLNQYVYWEEYKDA